MKQQLRLSIRPKKELLALVHCAKRLDLPQLAEDALNLAERVIAAFDELDARGMAHVEPHLDEDGDSCPVPWLKASIPLARFESASTDAFYLDALFCDLREASDYVIKASLDGEPLDPSEIGDVLVAAAEPPDRRTATPSTWTTRKARWDDAIRRAKGERGHSHGGLPAPLGHFLSVDENVLLTHGGGAWPCTDEQLRQTRRRALFALHPDRGGDRALFVAAERGYASLRLKLSN